MRLISSVLAATLVLARLLPIVALLPVFGAPHTPRRYRTGLAIVLTLVIWPALPLPSREPLGVAMMAILLAKEATIGLTIAVLIRMLFDLLAAAGAVIDDSRGASAARLFDPTAQQQTSMLSSFFLHLLVLIFVSTGGHRELVGGLADSFAAFPILETIPERWQGASAATQVTSLLGELFRVAVIVAAPVMVVLFGVDVALALLNRAAPQIQVFFLSLVLKPWLGLAITFLTLGLVYDEMLAELLPGIRAILRGTGP